MVIHSAFFVGSFDREQGCPNKNLPEVAFIGRSNVGKSSLINSLTGRKDIAKVSKVPGKTQLLNFFIVNDNWHLVDLPGYGYAKISKKKREKWEKMIERYLVNRPQLQCAFVLLDARIPLQTIDLEFINWLGERHIPFAIVYTKIDKVKKKDRVKNIKRIENELLIHWNFLPERFTTSSETRDGIEPLLQYISSLVGSPAD